MSDVVVIGSLNMDYSFYLKLFPKVSETVLAEGSKISFGGKGANQAIACARQGASVSFIGAVGSDLEGESMVAALQSEGIETKGIVRKEVASGKAVIFVDDNADNQIVVYKGANFELNVADIKKFETLICEAKYCIMQFEIPLEVIYYVLKLCKDNNVKTILNPAPYQVEFKEEYYQYVDLATPNENEFALLMKEEGNIDLLAQKYYELYHNELIVTLGKEGTYLYLNDYQGCQPAFAIEASDPTAAGDTYVGSLVACLVAGNNLQEADCHARKAAALSVSKLGAQEAISTKKEVEDHFNKYKGLGIK